MRGYRRSSLFCAYRRWLRIFGLILRDFLNMAKKIVIVDDNELNTKLFHDLRVSKGYDIIETGNGMEALKIVRVQMTES